MDTNKIKKVKKYAFIIALIFFSLTFLHLLYLFLNVDARETPKYWWSFTEGIIWEVPTLNPLINENDSNAYINRFLYRSLMKYDIEKWSFYPDLAECNLDDLANIRCSLIEWNLWSNWSEVKSEDIIETFKKIEEHKLNSTINSIFSTAKINANWNEIIFTDNNKDVLSLNFLLQPIVKKEVLESLDNESLKWNFKRLANIYSWKFILEWVNSDSSTWINTINLIANAQNREKNNIHSIKFMFFSDAPHLIKNKEKIDAFYDKDNVIWSSIPRLEANSFELNQYVWMFINYLKIKDLNLRWLILSLVSREEILTKLNKEDEGALNPYMSDIDIDKEAEKTDISQAFKEMWYYKKDIIAKQIIEERQFKIAQEEVKKKNKKLSYSSWWITDTYTFLWNDNILLTWALNWENPSGVWINDFKLRYEKWGTAFYFRMREDFWNIKVWENIYNIYFENDEWNKTLKETFYVYLYWIDEVEREEKLFYERRINEYISENNLWIEIDEETLEKIKELEDDKFYNSSFEPITFDIYYIDSIKEASQIAEEIKSKLIPLWVDSRLNPISILEFTKSLIEWEKNYDIMIAGINLWYYDFHIFPYFHSSQAKSWLNLANIKNPELDIVLEELKWHYVSDSKQEQLQERVLEIIKRENIIKTFYNPKLNYLVDRRIKNYWLEEKIPNVEERFSGFKNSFISSEKELNRENKNIITFIKFLFKILDE